MSNFLIISYRVLLGYDTAFSMFGHVFFFKRSLTSTYLVSPLALALQIGFRSGTFCDLGLVEQRSSAVKYTLETRELSLN